MEVGPPTAPVAIGAYVRGYPRDPSALDRYATMAGHWPAIVHVFRNWTDATRDFDPALADEVTTSGAALMISWQPPAGSLEAIAAGKHDAYVRDYARATRAWDGRLLLRFAHEMNGEWIPWLADPAVYRGAWRHLRAIFDEEGADTVAWVWSPHVRDSRAAPFEPYFPGADVVDWLALDGYNWGRTQSGSRWQTFDDVFAGSYRELVALAGDKPVMLAEIGCAGEGGDKAAWIRETFLDAIPNRYPAVRAVAWFHDNPAGHADWRVDSSADALDAWREVTGHPRYAGRLPGS
jgi:Glycosyl hydrolase family 26